jgi:hypothetical protein
LKEQSTATPRSALSSLSCLLVAFFSAVIAVAVAGVLVGVFINVVKMVLR